MGALLDSSSGFGRFQLFSAGLAHISGDSAGTAGTVGVVTASLHVMSHHLSQGSANYGSGAKYSLLLVCINRVLWEYT